MATTFLNILLCGTVLLGTLLLAVGFGTPGWIVIKRNSTRSWHNLWYQTQCSDNNTCQTDSQRRLLDKGDIDGLQYTLLLEYQVLATLCLATAIFGSVFTFVGVSQSKFSLMGTAKTVRCFAFCVAAMWRVVGIYSAENVATKDSEVGFPYALLLSALSTIPILIAGIWSFVSSQTKIRKLIVSSSEQQLVQEDPLRGIYPKSTLMILLVLTILGFMLQLVGFGSPGWVVSEGPQDQWYLSGEQSSAVGIFYYTACKADCSCHIEALRNVYRNGYDDVGYNHVVANGFCATVSQLVAGFAVLFGILSMRGKQASMLMLNLTEISCLLSATLVWPVIGEVLGTTVTNIQLRQSTTYMFPYSLFLTALGSLLMVIVYMVHTFKFFGYLFKRRNYNKNNNSQSVEFTKL